MRRRHPLLLGTALALAGAAPATGAEVQVTGTDALLWEPAQVNVQPGDTVVWKWNPAPAVAHNVASSPGAAWSYRSPDDATSGSFTFAATGSYAFICELHGAIMSGVVNVGNPSPPPPPPLSEQPFPNDATAPLAFETGGLDEAAPSIGGVRVRRGQLRFRVSEPSEVMIRFKRGDKIVATKRVQADGAYRMAVRASRSLRAGQRYRVELRARDGAGNASRLRSARLTVR